MPGSRGRRPGPPPVGTRLPPSAQILDIAFRRGKKASPHGTTKPERDRLRAKLKLVRSSATVLRHLRLETRALRPPALGAFEKTLIDGAFGTGTLERTLVRLRRAEERIRRLTQDAERALPKAEGPDELGEAVRRFYGRLASFVREVDPDLETARALVRYLSDRPTLDLSVPRLVVAGFPNVGKSSLVARLSSARPKVADYPFTTVAIAVGHADLGFDRLQVVDTPGVLNRSVRENPSEVEAEATVRGAATAVLFVLDPTGSCGYPIEEQERLLQRWREEFPQLAFIEVETKADVTRRDNARRKVSSVTGEGVPELRKELERTFAAIAPLPPPEAEEPTVRTESFTPRPRGGPRETRAGALRG